MSSPLHFRRIELKYILPVRHVPAFLERIAPYTEEDPFLVEEGKGRSQYPVTSLYFDSWDLQCLREKEAGLLRRWKVRLRTYHPTFEKDSDAFLEIKRRCDLTISKDRIGLPKGILKNPVSMPMLLGSLLDKAEKDGDVLSESQLLRVWYGLKPTCFVSYLRTPLVGKQDRRFRITIDSHLEGAWRPRALLGDQMKHAVTPGFCVVELKCDHAIPAWFHDIVQDLELRRESHSKYAMVMQRLMPNLNI